MTTADAPTTTPPPPARRRRGLGLRLPPWLGVVVVTAALIALTAYLRPGFLTAQNMLDIAAQQATTGIVAVGMVLVIVSGGIDLSVGSLLALAGAVGVLFVQFLLHHGWSGWTATVAGAAAMLAAGAAGGLVNGLLIARGRLTAFIATLATLLAFRSAAVWIADGGQVVVDPPPAAFVDVGRGWTIPRTGSPVGETPAATAAPVVPSRRHRNVHVAGPTTTTVPVTALADAARPLSLPYDVVVWAAMVLIGIVVLNRSRLGRHAVAVGSNARAARYSAVPVARVRTWVYALGGLSVGVAAFMEAGRNEASVSTSGAGLYLELAAIAGAVVGGTRMAGGVGSVFGSAVGVFLLGVINYCIYNLNAVPLGRWGTLTIDSKANGVVTGAIIIVAALAQRGRAAE